MQQSPPKTFGWKWPVFLIVITAEIIYMFQYASRYGSLSLIALILGSIVLGVILMRWEGSICWRRILYMQQHNQPATDEMRDGVLILFAGILMIIPGLVTDVIGLFLFLPPIRWIVRKLCLRNLYFEIPPGMESQFQAFTYSNQSFKDIQDDSSEESQSDQYDDEDREPLDKKSNVQIIDVEATDPQEKTPEPEKEDEELDK